MPLPRWVYHFLDFHLWSLGCLWVNNAHLLCFRWSGERRMKIIVGLSRGSLAWSWDNWSVDILRLVNIFYILHLLLHAHVLTELRYEIPPLFGVPWILDYSTCSIIILKLISLTLVVITFLYLHITQNIHILPCTVLRLKNLLLLQLVMLKHLDEVFILPIHALVVITVGIGLQ